MELKKSSEANLENKKAGFFFVGFVMISAIVGMAFEYSEFVPAPKEEFALENNKDVYQIYDIPEEEEIPEEEPEVAPPPPMVEDVEVVEDDEEVPEINFDDFEKEIDEIPVEETPEIKEEKVYDFVEVEPSFPGGAAAMQEWIKSKVEYPELAREMGEQGIVYVKFVVGSDGSIQNVKIAKGVSDALDTEAKRVVKAMPKWTPGEQAGKAVPVNFTLPINFRLG